MPSAAGEAVDWHDVERGATKSGDADLIRQLKIVSAIGATRRTQAPSGWDRAVEAGVAVVLAIAVAQLALAIVGAPAALARVGWPHVFNVLIFGGGGLVLLAGGGRDRRLPLLGGLFLIISSAFVFWLMPPLGADLGALTAALRPLQPEAFLALMLWRFVREFPADTQRPRARRVASVFVGVSFGVGAVLFTINAIGWFRDSMSPAWLIALFELFDRDHPEGGYWLLVATIAAPAVPFLLWKTRLEAYEDRRRVMLFVGALAVGLTPFVLALVAAPFVPLLRDPVMQQRVGVVLYSALASIVPITAYSVTVDRVMDLQFLIRITLQYALARYAVWAVSLGPLVYVGFDIQANQQLTISEYLERSRPAGPLVLSTVGVAALASRRYLLRAIDHWFLLEPSDQSRTLARLEQRYRTVESLRGISTALTEELSRALHARSMAVLLVNQDGTELVPVEGTTTPIRRDSALLEVLCSTRGDVQLDSRALRSIARLLPAEDREWLDDADAHLLFPLVGSTGMLLGMAAIGKARTGLPYSAAHFALVTAAGGQAAIQIENRWLRGRGGDEARPRCVPGAHGLDWQAEPAVYCPACRLIWSSSTGRCSCGTATTTAELPLFVQGKFRLERLVGTGGMGVVYLAVDMVLDRQVAIKTLPSLRSQSADRLHREARTMARVVHPNLALIYGTEQWRGTPMLIVEYLDGGTLRDWIRRGPVPCAEAIDLGIVLADVLDSVHASGVLHRDVKPSNIGYTSDRRPKLLDFGVSPTRSTTGCLFEGGAADEPCDRSVAPVRGPRGHGDRWRATGRHAVVSGSGGARRQRASALLRSLGAGAGALRSDCRAPPVRRGGRGDRPGGCRKGLCARYPRLQADVSPRDGVVSARRVVTEHHAPTGECERHAKRIVPAPDQHPGARSLTASRSVRNCGHGRSSLNGKDLAQAGGGSGGRPRLHPLRLFSGRRTGRWTRQGRGIRDRDLVAPAVSAGLPPCNDGKGCVVGGRPPPGDGGRSVPRPVRGQTHWTLRHDRPGSSGTRLGRGRAWVPDERGP